MLIIQMIYRSTHDYFRLKIWTASSGHLFVVMRKDRCCQHVVNIKDMMVLVKRVWSHNHQAFWEIQGGRQYGRHDLCLHISANLHSIVRILPWCMYIRSFRECKTTALFLWLLHVGINRAGPTAADAYYDSRTTSVFSDCKGTGRRRRGCKGWFLVTLILKYSPETLNSFTVPTAHQCLHNLNEK